MDDYLNSKISYIKGLKNPTEMQSLLVQLAEMSERSKEQQRQLDALVKLEKVNDRAAKQREEVAKIMQSKRDEDRKARNHRLIQYGALFELANLHEQDRGLLLGGLLHLAKMMSTHEGSPLAGEWKRDGDALLAARENKKKAQGAK